MNISKTKNLDLKKLLSNRLGGGFKPQSSISDKGFTLVETLVGTFLVLIIFLGIFGVFQLGLRVVGQAKNKITATAIANQKIEQIRNLPYESIGTKGGFPDGVLEASTTTVRNNIVYTVSTRVDYVVDSADGIASPDDDCPNDYKKAEVKVSWSGLFGGEVVLVTDIAPKNLAQECAEAGGILSVSVFNAYGVMVSSPLIEVKNAITGETLKTATPIGGKHYFSLNPGTYKVVVSKNGYSLEQTYGSGENYNGKIIATPEKPHPIVLEGQLTENSFSIDKLSSFSIDTFSPWGTDNFSDSFSDESKVSEKSNVIVSGGEVKLATTTEGEYYSSGDLVSVPVSPGSLIKWDEFSFSDFEPENTDLKYQIYYLSDTEWHLIPDSDLSGNSTGFDNSPVALSNLSTTTYSQLKLKGNFFTNSTNATPILYDWQVSWITTQATPIAGVTLNLKGAKLIGYDAGENPIYKYSTTTSTDSNGHRNISNLEWDSYTFWVESTSGLDLVDTNPSPQPIGLAPGDALEVDLYLEAENSLLVTVQNEETLEPIFLATFRVYNTGLGYDVTQYTNEKGQTFFIPLQPATYNLDVSGPGYSAASTTVWVSGDVTKIIKLEQIE